MNTQEATREDPIPAARLAEAGVWIARLHGDDRDRALEVGFRQWLRENPLNRAAFELSTEVWEDAQNLRRVIPFAIDTPPKQKKRFPFAVAITAATAAIVIAGIAVVLALGLHSGSVATEVGEQRLLTLEDGSRIFLNTATRVVVNYDKSMRRVDLETGEALFDVAKQPERPFVVSVGDRQVRAFGTSFVVRRDEQNLAVTLVEGKVSVSNPQTSDANAATVLIPGQRLTLTVGKPAQLDTPLLEKTVAWRRGQVVLDDTPLSSAVAEMNRYNSVKLAIEHPEAAELLVNGLFQAGDSTSFATAVAQTYGLHVVERDDKIILSGIPKSIIR